jgi:hypothetical protein
MLEEPFQTLKIIFQAITKMVPEVRYLKLLIDRQVVDVGTEISTTIPIMDNNPDNILIETPLRISFDIYTLFIYNRWTFLSEKSERVEELNGKQLTCVQTVSETLELWFNSVDVIKIDMSDNGYIGPEALVLDGPDNLTVVWN